MIAGNASKRPESRVTGSNLTCARPAKKKRDINKKMIYEIYICRICLHSKPHLAVLDAHGKRNAKTWCNECQVNTLGKWIKTRNVCEK